MTSQLDAAGTYTNLSALTELKAKAGQGSEAAVRETAEQFEALFLQMMLKSMRQATPQSELFGGPRADLYQDMFDKQISLELARKGESIGLTEMLVKQLQQEADAQAARPVDNAAGLPLHPEPTGYALATGQNASMPFDGATQRPVTTPPQMPAMANAREAEQPPAALSPRPTRLQTAIAAQTAAQTEVPSATSAQRAPQPSDSMDSVDPQAWQSGDPAAFIEYIRPHAQAAAERLGVAPEGLVAQAALETGWGRHMLHDEQGRPSFNLFNIKAGSDWQGPTVDVKTLEYEAGSPYHQQARFRMYVSPQAAFDDYVALLSNNPRYAQALEVGDDPLAFARELQAAGYATDPAYAEKLTAIMNRFE